MDGQAPEWDKREEDWHTFWKSHGKEGLASGGKAAVDGNFFSFPRCGTNLSVSLETFWVDLVLRNPLDAEVNLTNFTITVRDALSDDPESSKAFVEIEVIDEIVLGSRETRTVRSSHASRCGLGRPHFCSQIPISVKSSRSASLTITHATYDFLSLLPSIESLATRGRRLQDTALQRQSTMYALDVLIKVEIEEASHKLLVDFVDDGRLVLAQGECKQMRLWLSNAGTGIIDEVWMVTGQEDEIWVDDDDSLKSAGLWFCQSFMPSSLSPSYNLLAHSSSTEVLRSDNSLAPQKPRRIPLNNPLGSSSLGPGDSLEFHVVLHAERIEEHELCLLFVYREV